MENDNNKHRKVFRREQFELLGELGRGGTGVVRLARETATGRLYAIKTAKDGDESCLKSLREEASVLAVSAHPGIPAFYGELQGGGYVMEYVDGVSLREILSGEGRFDERETAEAGIALCEIIGVLHTKEPPLIYRDLKPSNIMVKKDGTYALIDFGAVRKFRTGAARDTQPLGTEGYAAPEQYGGWEQSDVRTDVYGIGAVLHHMITGRTPLETGLCPIGDILPALHGSRMEKILLRCCSVSPSRRYRSCAELKRALSAVIRSLDKHTEAAWNRFAALLRAAGACLLTAGLIAASASGYETARYDALIAEASAKTNLQDKASAYRTAALVRPADVKAYHTFLGEISADAVITVEEKRALESFFYAQGCLERMKQLRPARYAEMETEVGKRYFAFYEGGREAAEQAFLRAGAQRPSGGRRERRPASVEQAMLIVLGDGWQEDRAQVWRFLMSEAEREADRTKAGWFAAAVCTKAAGETALHRDKYMETGTDESEIREVVEHARRVLDRAERGEFEVPRKLREELQAAVEAAESMHLEKY